MSCDHWVSVELIMKNFGKILVLLLQRISCILFFTAAASHGMVLNMGWLMVNRIII